MQSLQKLERMSDLKPLLPRRNPWWIAVLLGMVVFGYVQEDAKIKLNHYCQGGPALRVTFIPTSLRSAIGMPSACMRHERIGGTALRH